MSGSTPPRPIPLSSCSRTSCPAIHLVGLIICQLGWTKLERRRATVEEVSADGCLAWSIMVSAKVSSDLTLVTSSLHHQLCPSPSTHQLILLGLIILTSVSRIVPQLGRAAEGLCVHGLTRLTSCPLPTPCPAPPPRRCYPLYRIVTSLEFAHSAGPHLSAFSSSALLHAVSAPLSFARGLSPSSVAARRPPTTRPSSQTRSKNPTQSTPTHTRLEPLSQTDRLSLLPIPIPVGSTLIAALLLVVAIYRSSR